MGKCDCQSWPHEDWCDRHPVRVAQADAQEQIDALKDTVERLESVLAAACQCIVNRAGDYSWQKQYDALNEFIDGHKAEQAEKGSD